MSKRTSLITPIIVATILVLTVIALRFEGRRWWCACGGWSPWISEPKSSHCSQHLFDPYSLTHIFHGVGLCGIFALIWPRRDPRASFVTTVALESLWEIVENSEFVIERYRTATIALGYEGDSIANSLGDVAACALGWALARRLGWRRSIVAFVAVELILLVWIRDNLTLNILMLAWPIDAIKQWQLGK